MFSCVCNCAPYAILYIVNVFILSGNYLEKILIINPPKSTLNCYAFHYVFQLDNPLKIRYCNSPDDNVRSQTKHMFAYIRYIRNSLLPLTRNVK